MFLSLDSFIPNRCYGKNKTSQTPNIDSLVNNGVLFTQAISSADGTELSWANIFTAKYTFQTGLNTSLFNKLSNKSKNYINILKDFGYHAYGTIPEGGSFLGITHDFENKDVVYNSNFRLYDGLGKQILTKFESGEMKEPWIYFIHLLDLHLSLLLPDEFKDEKYGIDKYDRMVSAVDLWIGKVLEKLDLKRTIIVLTSDHGEYLPSIHVNDKLISDFSNESLHKALWKVEAKIPRSLIPLRNNFYNKIRKIQKQIKLKKIENLNLSPYDKRALMGDRNDPQGYLYDEVIHIPLIFSGYGLPSKKISMQVRHIDIFPTITELIGCPYNLRNIQGQNLLPLIQGKELEEQPVYIECRYRLDKKLSDSVIGIRTSKYKYFRSKDKERKRVYLFDLVNDPNEENNIANLNPQIIEDMEKILTELYKIDSTEEHKEEMTVDEMKIVEMELRKLGYI